MTLPSCPRCGNPLAHEQDANGPRTFCRCCAYQLDPLVPTPEELAKMMKLERPYSRHDYFELGGDEYYRPALRGRGRPSKAP